MKILLKQPFLFTLTLLFSMGWSQPEDPIKVGELTAEFKKNRSILKVGCELKFSHPWHINSDTLKQEYLIETRIVMVDTTDGYAVKREFPKPTTINLLGEKMDVFDKDVSFKQFFYLNPQKTFPVKLKLQYQACSDKICLPPKFHEIKVEKTSDGKYKASI